MKSCWASEYNKCKGKISKEHLISSGIFEQKNIFVQGFNWCKDEEKEIGVANITANILCEKHNNGLSQIDQAGIDAVKIIESVLPSHAQSVNTSKIKMYIDGHNFEKWLLKTAINLSVNQSYHIGVGMADSQAGLPSAYLLAVLFGGLEFTDSMGLYFLYTKENVKFKAGTFSVYPVIKEESIAAFVFHIRGLDFILSLFPEHPVPTLRSLGLNNPTGDFDYILDSIPQYRSKSVVVNNFKEIERKIYFKW